MARRRVKVVQFSPNVGEGERVLEDFEIDSAEIRKAKAGARQRNPGAAVRVYDETGWLMR